MNRSPVNADDRHRALLEFSVQLGGEEPDLVTYTLCVRGLGEKQRGDPDRGRRDGSPAEDRPFRIDYEDRNLPKQNVEAKSFSHGNSPRGPGSDKAAAISPHRPKEHDRRDQAMSCSRQVGLFGQALRSAS